MSLGSLATFRLALLLAILCLLLTATASAGVRFGGVSVGFGYSNFPPYYYPYYDPFFFSPYWGPPYYGAWGLPPAFYTAPQGRPMGQVKIETADKQAEVYIEGAYAGRVQDLKRLWLDPGVYEFELRAQGKAPEHQRVYVLTNKTVTLAFGKAKE